MPLFLYPYDMRIICCICILFSGITFAQLPKCVVKKEMKLVWQDEFDGEKIDLEKWNFRYPGSVRGNGVVKKDNCYLDGEGHLVIEAVKADTNYYIGQVSTMKTKLFKYGYFECRAKLTTQVGTSCAFWLQSPTFGEIIGDPEKSGAEVDIFEYRRKYRTNEVHHTVHWDGYGDAHQQKGKSPIKKGLDDGEFHTFGLLWTEKKYFFFVDGKKSWCTRKAVSGRTLYIILSLEMNDWSGDPSNSSFPDKVLYDCVRVYQ